MNTTTVKITAKVSNATLVSSRPPSRTNSPRPPSPIRFTSSGGSSVVSSTTFRPKAKVNSSATVARKVPSSTASNANGVATPRAGSPTKLTRAQNGSLSPTFQPRATASNVSRRPQTPVSAPGTPDARTKSSGGLEISRPVVGRPREGSTSQLRESISFSSLKAASTTSTNTSPTMRIRSKVSNVSKGGPEKGDGPLLPSSVSNQARLRSASSSSNISQASNAPASQQFYPITTAAPAANPYRYNPMRAPPISRTYTPPPIGSINMGGSPTPIMTQPPTRPRVNGPAKVDLNSIPIAPSPLVPTPGSPLPPSSPPVSALSFSSRSSVSHSSSTSYNPVEASPLSHRKRDSIGTVSELFSPTSPSYPLHQRQNSNHSGDDTPEEGVGVDNEEKKVKAEAKSNRKIADLEISNKSLLTINASLEATKNRQAKEIRDLRRKLRETRLVLPPREFHKAQSSWAPEDEDPEDDSGEDSELEDVTGGQGDEIYKRVKMMIDGLLVSGRAALEKKSSDFVDTAKVLTAEEVHSWTHGDDNDGNSDLESHGDVSFASTTNSNDGDASDDENDDDDQDFFPNSRGPPIRISEAH